MQWLKIKDPAYPVPMVDAVQAARDMPLNQNGGDRKSEGAKSALYDNTEKQGTSKTYLLRRLSRDHPEVLDRIQAGELTARGIRAKERQVASGGDRGNQHTGGKLPVKEIIPDVATGQSRDIAAGKIGMSG